jgi:hypothetical protein
MESKKLLGQFYTTNSDYILQGLSIGTNLDIVEPFVGQGDLLKWIDSNLKYNSLTTYDLDPKINCSEIRNTLLNPPNYIGKYVITNPPYLAKNKNEDKTLYDKYGADDLYKAFIFTLVDGKCDGGIIIIPLNFFSSENSDTRLKFLTNYEIGLVNVFEEQVFNDTSYTICSFNFTRKENIIEQNIKFVIYPSKKEMTFKLKKSDGFRIGGDVLNCKNTYKFGRLLSGQTSSTNITLYAVDSGTKEGRIRLVIHDEPYFGKQTDRVFCTITSPNRLNNESEICEKFNTKLEELRDEYNSLFLTNYRESTKHYSRKRISFKQAFCLLNQIISQNENYFIVK